MTSIEESATSCKENSNKERWYTSWRYLIFPIYESLEADKVLKEKEQRILNPQNNKDYEYCNDIVKPYLKLNVADAEIFLNRTLDYKKTLEEKAKTNVIGITIATSLILGLSTVINSDNISFLSLRIIAFGLAVFSIIQMIIAGILSSAVLAELNRHYQLFPQDIIDREDEKLRTIALDTELNTNLNIRRNNYINSSYKSLRIAIVSLLILFLLFTTPNIFLSNLNQQKLQLFSSELKKLENTQIELNSRLDEIARFQNQMKKELQEIKERKSE